MKVQRRRTWLIYNIVILMLILGINGYVIAVPYLPNLTYQIDQNKPFDDSVAAVQGKEAADDTPPPATKPAGSSSGARSGRRAYTPAPVQRIVIPKLRVNNRIYEGATARTLNKGVWRRPNTSTPDAGGNMVLAAHRITYDGFKAFYNLDKLKTGDEIKVVWNNQEYRYRVTEVIITKPNDTSAEEQTINRQLTLYTCTPVPSFTQRIVVRAVEAT